MEALTTQVVIVFMAVLVAFGLGLTVKGFSLKAAMVAGVVVMCVLVAYGAVPAWGYAVAALFMLGLLFGGST